ncbi:hypothetical protein [Thauera aminoaromatica]|uniref:Site-specific integrase n=1 Tax=Thauera aminoaromatica TaxID=164330 RepID=A0A5C7S3R4_THASP|nr:hypothetical protein [Thauera aminoaromatica]TXH78568.1 MAG: site-specific integrase [Thauera aminoaromatica]
MNKRAILPTGLDNYFATTTREFSDLYQPHWLLDPPESGKWRLAFGSKLRTVSGEFKGTVNLYWNIKLKDGNLNDPKYETLLRHAKLLFLANFDGIGGRRTVSTANHFHTYLLYLIEFWSNSSPEDAQRTGLLEFDCDAAELFISSLHSRGVEGISRLCDRWDAWIKSRLRDVSKEELHRWLQSAPPDLKSALQSHDRKILSYDTDGAASLVTTEDCETLQNAKLLLLNESAYDKAGMIHNSYIAEALNFPASRVHRNARLRFHLRQFELATDYRSAEYPLDSFRTEPLLNRRSAGDRAQSYLSNGEPFRWLMKLGYLIQRVPELARSDLINTEELRERIARFNTITVGRTKSIPVSVGLKLIGHCVDWIQSVSSDLELHIEGIADAFQKSGGASLYRDLEKVMRAVPRPPSLDSLGIVQFWGRSSFHERAATSDAQRKARIKQVRNGGAAMSDALELHYAVCFVLLALFSCSRREEILSLRRSSLLQERARFYLRVELRKSGFEGAPVTKLKPVPDIAATCFRSMLRINAALLSMKGTLDSYVADGVFITMNRNGCKPTADNLYRSLDLLSEFFDLRTQSGRLWHVRPHQLRRNFALTFFHFGGKENVLPALTWLMGHDDIQSTWRYIKEELTGAEISATEAALATTAVYSPDQTASVRRLRKILLDHFDVEHLSPMLEEDVQDYLELLHEKGQFSATPIQVRSNCKDRFTVLISIKMR